MARAGSPNPSKPDGWRSVGSCLRRLLDGLLSSWSHLRNVRRAMEDQIAGCSRSLLFWGRLLCKECADAGVGITGDVAADEAALGLSFKGGKSFGFRIICSVHHENDRPRCWVRFSFSGVSKAAPACRAGHCWPGRPHWPAHKPRGGRAPLRSCGAGYRLGCKRLTGLEGTRWRGPAPRCIQKMRVSVRARIRAMPLPC